jgi:hypothetical protein
LLIPVFVRVVEEENVRHTTSCVIEMLVRSRLSGVMTQISKFGHR